MVILHTYLNFGITLKTFQESAAELQMNGHLQKKLREHRAIFDAMLGPNYNVLNPVLVVCMICEKEVRLSTTGGMSYFASHIRRRHPTHSLSVNILEGLKRKGSTPSVRIDTTGAIIISKRPKSYFEWERILIYRSSGPGASFLLHVKRPLFKILKLRPIWFEYD